MIENQCSRRVTIAAALGLASVLALPAPAAQPPAPTAAIEMAESLSDGFAYAASIVQPSVVNVRSTVRVEPAVRQRGMSPFENSPFRDFFGDDFFERFQLPGPNGGGRGGIRQGQGSGFVVSDAGSILTNTHVIDGATEVTVQLHDEREFVAEVIGTDPATDLALLRIDADGLEPVTFGDSDNLTVGTWVIAAGNPFGLESTITSGIVSATGRTGVGITDYENFIQTDAAINPGNSGGPLVNLRGEVVGVNTAIATRSGGNMGIGFAIPSTIAVDIMENLREDGVVTRGWLGVQIQPLTSELAATFGYDGTAGALVSQILPGGPAAESELRSGDIITAINGEPILSPDDLRFRVAGLEPGEDAEFDVFREGRVRSFDVRIGNRDGAEVATSAQEEPTSLGLGLRSLEPEIARQLGVDTERGVVVTAVEPLSDAARAGLRPRDVITHVNGQEIASTRDFRRAIGEADLARGVRLTVLNGQSQRFLVLRSRD